MVLSIFVGLIGAGSARRALANRSRLGSGLCAVFPQHAATGATSIFLFRRQHATAHGHSTGTACHVPLINNAGWAIISFSLFAGAFNVEIFRSGIEAVPRSTVEAAEALGYTRLRAYVYVIIPLAFRVCLPALGNNLVNLVKTTTLAYAIGVPELLYAAAQIWSESFNVREMMWVLLFTYFIIVAALVFVMQRWERALRIPGYSAGYGT